MHKPTYIFFAIVWIVISCTAKPSSPTPPSAPSAGQSSYAIAPTHSQQSEDNISPKVTDECIPVDLSGIPVDNEIKDSHILYGGYQIDQTGQIWSIDTKGVRKLLLDKLEPTSFGYGIGFLENDDDFLMAQNTNIFMSDLSGHEPISVAVSDVQHKVPASSPLWTVINGQLNALLSGERFSPDSKQTVVWKPGDSFLILKDVSSGEEKKIIPFDNTGYIDGSWSPDGTQYVITRTRIFKGEHSQVLIMESNGDNLQELSMFENKNLGHPYWSPDGKKIVFSISDDMNFVPYEYAVLNISTGAINKYRVEAYPGSSFGVDNNIVWSPDGNWILFYTRDRYLDYTGQSPAFYPNDLRALDLHTEQTYCLTQSMQILDVRFADWK